MKLESLVITGQLYCGEYVLKSCTHNKSAQQVKKLGGSNPPLVSSTSVAEGSQLIARLVDGGPKANYSLDTKKR